MRGPLGLLILPSICGKPVYCLEMEQSERSIFEKLYGTSRCSNSSIPWKGNNPKSSVILHCNTYLQDVCETILSILITLQFIHTEGKKHTPTHQLLYLTIESFKTQPQNEANPDNLPADG